MTDSLHHGAVAVAPRPPKYLPGLVLLFFASGCAALIYEIVWFQLLQLVIGSSAISLAVLLGTFMGGMCLGSLGLARLVSASRHPLRVYAGLELGIAVSAVLVLYAMPAVGRLYLNLVGHGLPGILLRAAICVLCLLPPTVLMGATLPAVARWIETTPRGISWLGFFYGGNTIGAVAGCLLAGFYLLRLFGGATATWFAVSLNVAVAIAAVVIARRAPYAVRGPRSTEGADNLLSKPEAGTLPMLVAIGLSGFCALAAEVVWTRNLSLLLGATVYTFSIILAVFLAGLGMGSSAGAALARQTAKPRLAFALCQLLQILGIAWAAYSLASTLPYWTLATLARANLAAKFEFDLLRCAWAILPSAILWGASFPLAIASTVGPGQDAARLLGRAYAANTLGAIGGAILAGMALVPWLGTQGVQMGLIAVSVVAAVVALRPRTQREIVLSAAGVALAFVVAGQVPRVPWELVAYGRQMASSDYGAHAIYFGEGMNASVAVTETPGGGRFFHVSGKTEASSLLKDMRLQRMLGHIPALLHPEAKSVLIVGCGAGVTAGTFVLHPSIRRIVICDIEPLIPRVVAAHFQLENHNVLRDPRVEVVYDDARHYIATTQEKFDLITSDPIHPWVKGSAVLYSQEYFALCRARLNPGGLLTQWVPLYEADRAVVQSEIATFFSVFPEGTIWGNDDDGYGYDTVMLGQAEPLKIDIGALQQRFERPDHATVRKALTSLGLGSAIELLGTYAGRYADLRSWLAGAELNRDRNLRLQYLAGLQLDSNRGADAYEEILKFRQFPSDLFQGTPAQLAELQMALLKPLAATTVSSP